MQAAFKMFVSAVVAIMKKDVGGICIPECNDMIFIEHNHVYLQKVTSCTELFFFVGNLYLPLFLYIMNSALFPVTFNSLLMRWCGGGGGGDS